MCGYEHSLSHPDIIENNFEEEDIESFAEHLKSFEIRYVHELFEHPWGQRVIRFYDPDGHIIEVGEKITAVVRRFINGGMSEAETAERMDVPLEYVQACLRQS